MADVKISALPASSTPLAGTEVLPIVQGTTTKQVSVANLTAGRAASASSLSLTNDSNITNILDVLATPTASNTSGIRVWNNTQSGLLWLSGSAYSYAGVGANEVWLYASNTSLNVGPDSATGSLKFTTNGAERARIFPSGGVSIGNTTDPGAGNLSVTGNVVMATSGKGIDFSATPGTGTSELFADYEEGTWTPTIGGNATYLVQEGYYTKIGRVVTIQGKIQINVIGTGSTTTISGLPFAQLSASNASNSGGGVSYFAGIATLVFTLIPYVINGNTTIIFESQTAAGFTSSEYQTTVFQGGTRLDFFLTYTAAS